MNKITDYIEEISQNVNIVANGNMDINIPIKGENELGTLASDVNKMACSIKELMTKERQWEKQKNNLITNLSYDLRTPLTSVIGFLELIEQAIIGFIPSFESSGMEYRIFSKDTCLKINGDAILLVRPFENIISNAIKYGSEGKYLDINIEKEYSMAVISFVNYGEMIEYENSKNLFQRLYRVEKSCDKKEGTGLGLAIVKTVVELHKGDIQVASSKEKTEFKIKLPFGL